MSLNVQHQAPGQWDLTLDPDTPEDIVKLSARFFGRLILTPTRIDPRAVGVAGLLAVAHYSGILFERGASRHKWHGHGLAVLLGDDHGLGNTYDSDFDVNGGVAVPFNNGSSTSWLHTIVLRPGSDGAGGLTKHASVPSAASPTRTGKVKAGDTQFKLLNHACRIFGYEWFIDPSGAIHADTAANLWASFTATADARVKAVARGGSNEGLPNIAMDADDDVRDYTTDVTVNGQSSTTGDDSITSPYVDLNGDPIIRRRVISSANADTNTQCDTIAAQQLGRFDQPDTQVELSTDRHDIDDLVDPGDTIMAFDPELDLYDTTNPVPYDGRTIYPVATRVFGGRQPIREAWGKYFYSWNGSAFELADLSDYVIAETGPIVLEVGAPKRRRGITPTSIAA